MKSIKSKHTPCLYDKLNRVYFFLWYTLIVGLLKYRKIRPVVRLWRKLVHSTLLPLICFLYPDKECVRKLRYIGVENNMVLKAGALCTSKKFDGNTYLIDGCKDRIHYAHFELLERDFSG